MRDWLVGGALIESPDGLLLVCNRRRNGSLDWTPPGGVIDEGEELLAGLTREVEEETGLVVTDWVGPLYEIHAEAPGLGWRLRVEAWLAADYVGNLRIDDPDGIVIDALFVRADECSSRLEGNHPWVTEPVTEWLGERWREPRRFDYRVEGAEAASVSVSRW